jgi:hypothetical protein
MADHTGIVKNFLADLEESALRMEPGERADRRQEVVRALKELLKERRELKRLTEPLPNTLGDISDLPEELLGELTITNVGELDSQIYTIINAAGKKADLDTILVGLFKRFGEIHKRRTLGNKLWRMIQKEDGTIWATPDEKGTYQTTDPAKSNPKAVNPLASLTTKGLEPSSDELDELYPYEPEDGIPF